MPRRKKPPAPPGLAEDPAALEAEAAGAAPPRDEAPGPKSGKKKPAAGPARRAAAPEPEPTIPFPVEAIALLHLELWNALAKKLRSRYELSANGAQEMANYAELCIRQYLGPYLAEHAALAAYVMTQGAAVLALLALRDTPNPAAAPAPGAAPARPPEGLYARPVTSSELRPPIGSPA